MPGRNYERRHISVCCFGAILLAGVGTLGVILASQRKSKMGVGGDVVDKA